MLRPCTIRIAFALALALAIGLAAQAQEARPAISAADDASKPFVVKIHADWCGTCARMNPTFEVLNRSLADRARVVVLDVTDQETTARAEAEAERLGIQEFFDANKAKTGTVGILAGDTRATIKVLRGETDPAVYERFVASAVTEKHA